MGIVLSRAPSLGNDVEAFGLNGSEGNGFGISDQAINELADIFVELEDHIPDFNIDKFLPLVSGMADEVQSAASGLAADALPEFSEILYQWKSLGDAFFAAIGHNGTGFASSYLLECAGVDFDGNISALNTPSVEKQLQNSYNLT